jgi:hypothetical protein
MAFSPTKFQLLGGNNNNTGVIGLYRDTGDTLAAIAASGYFNDKTLDLPTGSLIVCVGSDGTAIRKVTASGEAAGASSTVVTTAPVVGGASDGEWVTVTLTDVSAASSAYIAAPFAGTIRRIKTILQGAITVANANVKLQIATVDVTGAAVVITASGSAAGDVDEATATAANTVTAGQAVEIESDGGSTTTAALVVMVEFVPTA